MGPALGGGKAGEGPREKSVVSSQETSRCEVKEGVVSNERETSPLAKKAEEFLHIFRKGEEFTQELLKENERLRYRLVQLDEEQRATKKEESLELRTLRERVSLLEEEKERLLQRHREVEEENKLFASRYLEVEEENNKLANLYVASYQLHSTLNSNEVLRTVLEIIINLVGAERFAIYLLDEKTNELAPVATEGVEAGELPTVRVGEGILGDVARSGESCYAPEYQRVRTLDPQQPLVCIPLKIKEHVIGLIAVYTLFEQKQRFTNVDEEIFSMLAGHAATAIFASRLYGQSERKLMTIQGFLDLLKQQPEERA